MKLGFSFLVYNQNSKWWSKRFFGTDLCGLVMVWVTRCPQPNVSLLERAWAMPYVAVPSSELTPLGCALHTCDALYVSQR